MITVVIPTLDAEQTLPATLGALVTAAVDGLVREVIVVDGGSRDSTRRIAEEMGATVLTTGSGRGAQLAAGAAAAHMPWLLFLHADTVLQAGWEREVWEVMRGIDNSPERPMAAAFRFGLDDRGFAPRWLELMVRLRSQLLAMPYGDQSLLIRKSLYDAIGGYKSLPLMEDVDIVRRLGRRRLTILRTVALTSARRYRQDGYLARTIRNQMCLLLYFAGMPVERVARLYGGKSPAERRQIE
jgi:rSAM/selenodomain-associated transferase 2